MKRALLLSTLIASSLFAQGYVQQANIATKDLLKTLGSNMKKEMKASGPLGALTFCNINAENLIQQVDDKYGKILSIKRISLKPRNPKNKPSKDEKIILSSMQKMMQVGVKAKNVIQDKGDTIVVYKPLVIKKKACLICHGDMKNQKLANKIKSLYPKDKATHYKMGDLRGAIVVTLPKSK